MAVKKLIYKHLNTLGFSKCGHTCVKKIDGTNYYALVSVERDRHPSYKDMKSSIENDGACYVVSDRIFYDIHCDVVYWDKDLTPKDMKDIFKDADVDCSLCKVLDYNKHRFYKIDDSDDVRVVNNLLAFFYELFYDPVFNKKRRSRMASDDNVSLYTYLKAFFVRGTIEFYYAETLCRLAFDEGKYEDALYYAKRTLIYYRPNEFDYVYALENFNEVYHSVKNGDDAYLKEIIKIYDDSVEKIYMGTK